MEFLDAFEEYEKKHGANDSYRSVFSFFDSLGIKPETMTADDLSRYFLSSDLSKKSRVNIRWIIRQVLRSRGIDCGWMKNVAEPPPSYYLTLSELLSAIDSYADSCEGIEPSGFDTVKACVVLAWTGLNAGQMSAMKYDDLKDGKISCGSEVFTVEDGTARELLESYQKSEGYIFYQKENASRKGNSRFLPFVEKEYFLRSVRPVKNRDRYPYTLFLRIKDLGIRMNSVRKAGEFSRLYDSVKNGGRSSLSGTRAAEFKEYVRLREEAES